MLPSTVYHVYIVFPTVSELVPLRVLLRRLPDPTIYYKHGAHYILYIDVHAAEQVLH